MRKGDHNLCVRQLRCCLGRAGRGHHSCFGPGGAGAGQSRSTLTHVGRRRSTAHIWECHATDLRQEGHLIARFCPVRRLHGSESGSGKFRRRSVPKFEHIDDNFREFIEGQKVFFVGTAAREGRVNIAAKGMDTLRVVGPNRIVWLNLTGSENETAAHVLDSPRMTLMWCSFEARALVLRAYGDAKVFHPRVKQWQDFISLFPSLPGARQIVDLDVDLVMTSCGFGVPFFDFVAERQTLQQWGEKKGPEGVREFWEKRNQVSIDG